MFELERPDRAEVAFAVADEMQGRGLATVLIAHLAQVASARGVTTFTATVLPENRRMISVFRESGFPVEVHASPDGIELEFPTELGEDARRRFEDRDRVAAVAAVERVLRPRSVAVIGASRRPDSFGGAAFRHALANGFRGELYPVNPNADFVGSPARRRRRRSPGPVDLAIVAVPADAVPGVARECAAAGVAALVVITAGFAEAGAEGAARLAELLEACRASGMRLVGPNCMGVVNTRPDVSLTGDVRARRRARGDDRLRLPERGVRRGGDRRRVAPRDRAVRVRLAGRQGRPVEQRRPAVLGAGPGDRRSSRCIWSRSATRASSAASRGGWRGRSRCWRSRRGGRRPARGRRPRTRAR